MIVGICKMHANEINFKNRAYKNHFDNLVKTKEIETKNISIDEKNYKDLIFSLDSKFTLPGINGKDWITWTEKYFMVDDYMLNKALGKIQKMMVIEKFDDIKIFNDTDDNLPYNIALKNVVILMAWHVL